MASSTLLKVCVCVCAFCINTVRYRILYWCALILDSIHLFISVKHLLFLCCFLFSNRFFSNGNIRCSRMFQFDKITFNTLWYVLQMHGHVIRKRCLGARKLPEWLSLWYEVSELRHSRWAKKRKENYSLGFNPYVWLIDS